MKNHPDPAGVSAAHSHNFLGETHESNERKTWTVIWLCGIMMLAEIVGGGLFGSLALVADGLHMSTHAGALLIAALAYTYARRHAHDSRFVFGTGKLGDLAGFSSAIILAMIALLIGYEAVLRLLTPVQINFSEAIPIAIVGLFVNIISAWLLSGDHHHGHHHGHQHAHPHHAHHAHPEYGDGSHQEEVQHLLTSYGIVAVEVFEDGAAPCFRLHFDDGIPACEVTLTTVRETGEQQIFTFAERAGYLESQQEIPEPHQFKAVLKLDSSDHALTFTEHAHGDEHSASSSTHRDNNMRAAYVHVIADAAVSVLTIAGLLLAKLYGWLWMDPVAGIIGAVVIANWSYRLLHDTGGILLDIHPDHQLAEQVRAVIEVDGDCLRDLHLWRLGPGHIGAILSIVTREPRDVSFYRMRLGRFTSLSHVTVEIDRVVSYEHGVMPG